MTYGVFPSSAGGGGGGGAGIGTYANRPAAGTTGAQYYATDATGLSVDDGSEWRPIVSSLVCRRVDLSTLNTWVNQAGSIATQYGDAALVKFPNTSGNNHYSARVQLTNNCTEVIGCWRAISAQPGNPLPFAGILLGHYPNGDCVVGYGTGYTSPASFYGGSYYNNPTSAGSTSQNNSTNGSSGPVFVRVKTEDMGGGRVDGVIYLGPTPNGPWLEVYRVFNFFNGAPPNMVGVYGVGYNTEANVLFEHFETR
jgi:hypothetical protein